MITKIISVLEPFLRYSLNLLTIFHISHSHSFFHFLSSTNSVMKLCSFYTYLFVFIQSNLHFLLYFHSSIHPFSHSSVHPTIHSSIHSFISQVDGLDLQPIKDSAEAPVVVHGTYLEAWQFIQKQVRK